MNLQSSQGKLLTFEIDETVLGMDIKSVQEINKFRKITTTPKTPEYIEGMINLRGNIVTIINLGTRLSGRPVATKDENIVIVINLDGELLGLMIDQLDQVISYDSRQLDLSQTNFISNGKNFYKGVLQMPDKLVRVLNIEKIISF